MSRPPVHVRMYRDLLGDCFMLTIGDLSAKREDRVHILIDCGVLQQVPGEAKLMHAVADDIRTVVGDYVDLMVITHEHWDHISGFAHARDRLIDTLEIKALWLAWTERRGDPQADGYRAKSSKAKATIARIAEVSGGRAATGGLSDFTGAARGKLKCEAIIPELIKRATQTGSVSYLEPGQVLDTPGHFALRAHVFGPPRTPKRLTQDLPSPGDAKETYLAGDSQPFSAALGLRYAVAEALDGALDSVGIGPFGQDYRRSCPQIRAAKDVGGQWVRDRYFAEETAWRRIDGDWLGAAGALALKLDSDTNNTSLVLAFEIEPGGDVLLFAADAQVGNWLSWHDQDYPSPHGAGAAAVPARALLRRTVLYKVGHHASHNATLEADGLELMTHPKLCAMIPVVEAEARRVKDGKAVHRGWNMPFPDLYARLLESTGGRLLRGDAEAGRDPNGATICDDSAFLNRTSGSSLYHELRF